MGTGCTLTAMLITGFLALMPSLHADWQDRAPRAELIDQLQNIYPLTVMDGIRVLKPGTVLVLQQSGIQANPMKLGPFRNKYENGQVTAGGLDRLRKYDPTGGLGRLPMQPRVLLANEKVYLLKMEPRDDGINMTVQTCGICDTAAVDPAYKPYVASIQFSFTKGFWAATDLSHLQAAINQLLAIPYSATAATAQSVEQQGTAQASRQNQTAVRGGSQESIAFPDLTPPERPAETQPETALEPRHPTLRRPDEAQAKGAAEVGEPAKQPVRDLPAPPRPIETKPEINIGWTPDQVIAVLGTPDKTDKRDRSREIYSYQHMTLTFERGKVVSIVSNR